MVSVFARKHKKRRRDAETLIRLGRSRRRFTPAQEKRLNRIFGVG